MRQYSSYKFTGASWITEIPTEWKTARLKTCVGQITERAENNNGYIGLENVESWTGKYISKKKNEAFEAEGTSISVHKGNVLFGKLRPYLAKCYIAEADGCCSTEFIVMEPKGIDSSFLKYLILSPSFIDNINMSTYGSKMPRANWDFIGNMLIPIPSAEDQSGIVSYLNHKIGQIDEVITEAKASIEEYKQWKASIIYEAVTKGLDPDAEMVDSCVEWIGLIPKGWKITTLKRICKRISDGSHFSPDTTFEGYPYVTAGDVHGKGIDFNKCRTISKEDFDLLVKAGCQPQNGDVLLVKDGATTGRVGMMIDNTPCVLLSSVAMLTPGDKTDSNYLRWLMESEVVQYQIRKSMAGSAMPRTTLSKLMAYSAIDCPISDQIKIADFLEAKCAAIESLIGEKEALISDLEAYKKSLIFEVVTGKRKVV